MTPLTVGSLFSGIGGMDLGLARAGFQIRWQVEIDDYCRRILTKHWPDVPKYTDVRTLTGDELEPVNLIAGGFPCQPVSLAGQRRGQDDERWLWPHFARLLRVVRPRYVIVENVPGLLGRGMGDVLGDLAALGYDAEWESLPAAAFGAPHLRWRVFIVAYRSSTPGQGVFGRREQQPAGGPAAGSPTDPDDQRPLFPVPGPGASQGPDWWATEPGVGRVVHGVPQRVDRLAGLGNAVVPQVIEWIGRHLIAWES